ncbi:type I-E CRISPR-associated protein Cas5/CasD [Nocardiopsis sp. CC223A]|uniref:type I-E CRISPR-associated protein Cas5/CasD n=1 Tax=Nocardiopsis sp. CC223A TaxID=3044051 RepID=UPI00278C86BC|nr:type I-E CRISPR-associated protein Cas5/CasD [Nocardiopsis sp. CC223A]
MSDVLVLRLSAPLQSWGGHSRHTTRGTLTHPTKSGVVGLCAAALGRPRGTDLSDLAALRLGVRVDRPGTLLVDFHTVSAASHGPLDPKAQRLPTSGGGRLKPGEGKVSRRAYLQDAVFVAALEATGTAQRALLEEVEAALRRPRYPLFLGRRSCPPDRPVLLGLHRDTDLASVLSEVPWQGSSTWERHRKKQAEKDGREYLWQDAPADGLPVIVDDANGGELLPDLPLPGHPFRRSFGDRPVSHDRVPAPGAATAADPLFSGDAAMAELDDEGGL